MGSDSEHGATPRTPQRPLPMGKLVAGALVANLLLVAGGAAVFAPVESSRTALDAYDGLPDWMRALLGDRPRETVDGESQTVGGPVARGPIGSWLEDLYLSALDGDKDAQLAMPLELQSDVPVDEWSAVSGLEVHWLSFDSGFRYRLAVTETPEAPDLQTGHDVETMDSSVTLPVPEGSVWVHIQAAGENGVGPVTTTGPYKIDRTAPPVPGFIGGNAQTIPDYHYAVTWGPVEDTAPIVAYRLQKSLDGNRWDEVARITSDDLEHQERNQPNGRYHYRVLAENAAGLVSAPGAPLVVTVDARANLQRPGYGTWHYGINATYDSVIHLWDLSDPSRYLTLDRLSSAASPKYGGLTEEEYARYTAPGWGIELANRDLCDIAAAELGGQCSFDAGDPATTHDDRYHILGGEKNTLEIGIKLFAWLFDATDYDFEKFNDPAGQDFLKASETLERGLGICGDLTALYLTMMRMAGVPARPVHGYLENNEDGIGGFHMWAEIYVGGNHPVGGGWLPVDVSGVTGSYEPEHLLMYFGVANPLYLQLGIQEDLGEPDLPRDDPRARWNVWANMQYTYYQKGSGGPPQIDWEADARISPVSVTTGRIWFDPATLERQFCEGTDRCGGDRFVHYYDDVRGRSVRNIDYGADLGFTGGQIEEIVLKLKFPAKTAPNQVAIYTLYQHDAACRARAAEPVENGDGFLAWHVPGERAPCSA